MKKQFLFVVVFAVLVMALSACGAPAPAATEAPVVATEAPATEAPAVTTEAPAEVLIPVTGVTATPIMAPYVEGCDPTLWTIENPKGLGLMDLSSGTLPKWLFNVPDGRNSYESTASWIIIGNIQGTNTVVVAENGGSWKQDNAAMIEFFVGNVGLDATCAAKWLSTVYEAQLIEVK